MGSEVIGRDYTVQSVGRALAVLRLFTHQRPELGLADIARDTGLTKSSCHRILATLERAGFVAQVNRGRYALGLAAAQVGAVALDNLRLPVPARDILMQLSTETGETVGVSVLDGAQSLLVERVESAMPLSVRYSIGTHHPAYATASGKVLLAHSERREELLAHEPLVSFTPRSVTDRDVLRKQLQRVRTDGYAVDREELHIGLSCVAVPIRDPSGRVVAAVAVSGPSLRMRLDQHTNRIATILRRYAADLEVCLYDGASTRRTA